MTPVVLVDAFVALGGKPDRSGYVDNARLVHVVKEEFGMTVKIDVGMENYTFLKNKKPPNMLG